MDVMTPTLRPIEFVQREPQADILVVTNMWPEPSRPVYGIFVKRQVEALRAAGLRCDVLYLRGYLSKATYLLSMLRFLRFTLSARGRYRITHVHAGETALVARFFMMRPMIATYHGDDMLGHRGDGGSIPIKSMIRAAVVRWHASLFTATITQSSEMHRRLNRWVQRRNTVIRCGVDAQQFFPADRSQARDKLDWNDTERIVLFAATRPYDALKRLDLAQAAVTHAEAEVGPIRLVVAENVAPDFMPIMMNAADCLLLTSMSEGSPMVVKEAVLCTLPVVATDVGDVRDLLTGISPSAVCRHEPSELGSALAGVLKANRRCNGRDQSVHLDQATTVHQLLSLYAQYGVRPDSLESSNAAPS